MRTENHSREATLRRYRAEKAACRKKKFSAAAVSIALAGVLGVGATIAYLVDHTASVENTFTPSVVTTEIEENFSGSSKSDVYIENTSNIHAYVRAKIVINWVDASGAIVANAPSDYTYTMSVASEGSGWVLGADGFYYYTAPLPPYASASDNDCTNVLIDSIVASKTDGKYFLSVEILSEAIQAEGGRVVDGSFVYAVEDAWSNDRVTIEVNEGSSSAVSDDTLSVKARG